MNDSQLWFLMVVGLLANKNVHDINADDVRKAGDVADLIAVEGCERSARNRKEQEDHDALT